MKNSSSRANRLTANAELRKDGFLAYKITQISLIPLLRDCDYFG
jgi:hypothetical protein